MRAELPGADDEAALLIDADNVSAPGIDAAVAHLEGQGLRLTIRRAYGGLEKLGGMRECLLRHGVRAFANQGKGTTDALLVVDAMDLLHAGELPARVAIVSSDADFAPLAVRLREGGLRVSCFAHAAKSADTELARCYDELVYVETQAAPAASAPAPAPAQNTMDAKPARKAPARKTTARKTAAAALAPAPADPVRELLDAMEGFRQGRALELNEVVKRLRDAKLLARSASGPTFLKKNAPYAELLPPEQPNKVRRRDNAG
jgi:hypothetical protein